MSLIPIKDWIYLGVIVLMISAGLYERQHLINEGAKRCLDRERVAAEKQAAQDTKIAEDTVDALNLEISRLRGTTLAPATPPVRVRCTASPVPAPKGVPGTPAAPAAPGGGVQPVSPGTREGPDLGPSLQRIALAADILSARDRACLKELKEP